MSFGIAGVVRTRSRVPYRTCRAYKHTLFAERPGGHHGFANQVAIMDSPTSSVKFFLPRRYGDVVSDGEQKAINSQRVALILIYKGRVRDRTHTS